MSCVLLVEMVVVLLVLAKEVRVLLCLLDVLQPTAWHPLNTFIVQSFPRLMILSLFIHPYTMVKPQCLPREIAFVMKVVAFYKQSKSWHLLQFLRVNNQQTVSSCRWWWLCSCCRRFSWRKQTRSHLTSWNILKRRYSGHRLKLIANLMIWY